MDVINIMTAEEYAEYFPRASKEIVRIQASETSAFETTPYGKRLMAEEAEKEEEKQKEAHKVKNPLLTTQMGRFLVVRIVGQHEEENKEENEKKRMATDEQKDGN
ncbi:hypothetical protein B9Z55_007380 [Caenorhabditis nigoni]|uniref:Uncharacterized protein n=1 Tax=Caenorhabditis nigoni TaxID=1611254 RepID=A0A2G5VA35_9PELO|nr:hypothetical protein B9Z55_007380 [Caenorhabditis nigoni]